MFYMILGGLLGFWLGAKEKLGMIVDYTLLGILCGLDSLSNTAVVLGATNRIDRIDEALLRRFSIRHEVKILSPEERIEFVKKYLNDVGVILENTEQLAAEYENQSTLLNAIIREIATQMLQEE